MGRGSGDWLFRRPGSRYRVSGRGGRQISRTLQLGQSPGGVVHLRHCQAEPVPQEPEPFGAGPGDRPLQLPPVDGISRAGGGARRGCRTRCGRAAWVFITWCGMIPVHCERQGRDGDHRRCPCEDSVHCIAFLERQYSRNCRMLMPELIWHGTISCPLSSVHFRKSFVPANQSSARRRRYGQKRHRPGIIGMRARQYSRRAQREMRGGNKENAGFCRPVCVAAGPLRAHREVRQDAG